MTGAMEGCMPVGMEADAWQADSPTDSSSAVSPMEGTIPSDCQHEVILLKRNAWLAS